MTTQDRLWNLTQTLFASAKQAAGNPATMSDFEGQGDLLVKKKEQQPEERAVLTHFSNHLKELSDALHSKSVNQ